MTNIERQDPDLMSLALRSLSFLKSKSHSVFRVLLLVLRSIAVSHTKVRGKMM